MIGSFSFRMSAGLPRLLPTQAASRRLRGRPWKNRLGALAVLSAAALFAVWTGATSEFGGTFEPLSGTNAVLYDAALGVLGRMHATTPWQHAAVVLIDNRTLASPPWATVPRALQQPQLGRLGLDLLDLGVRKVGYDLVVAFDPADLAPPFQIPPGYDAPLVRLLTEHADDVVLGADAAVAPARRYRDLLDPASLGVIDVRTEADGRVRSVADRIRLPDGTRAFGLAAALASGVSDSSPTGGRTLIVPPAPVDAIPHITAADLSTCLLTDEGRRAARVFLDGKIAIVGAGLAGEDEHSGPDRFLSDGRPVPDGNPCAGRAAPAASRTGRVPGVFLQAAAVESLLAPHPPALAAADLRIFSNLLVVAGAVLLRSAVERVTRRIGRPRLLLGTTAVSGFVLVLSILAAAAAVVGFEAAVLGGAHLWVPLGPIAVAMTVLCSAQTVARTLRQDVRLADLRLTFGRWLPPPVVISALEGGSDPLHGEERVISVLIADLVDFTSFCAGHAAHPERIVAALNGRFSEAQAVIDRHGGCLDKFVGDAVIAFWNGIEPQAEHARRAVAAAAEIVAANRQRPDGPLRFRCAVATGVAFVGRYGSDQKSSFSAIGEPMNLAARLESLCRSHGLDIVLAQGTVQALRAGLGESMNVRRVGQTTIRGFSEEQVFYTVDPLNSDACDQSS